VVLTIPTISTLYIVKKDDVKNNLKNMKNKYRRLGRRM